MSPENSRRYSPPYISPRSFYHLLEILQETSPLPGRIDRSFLDQRYSGSVGTQVMAAMRFLNLVDGNNKPTHHLRLLVESRGEERPKRLKDLCTNAFGTVFTNGTMDLGTATYAQLEEFFHEHYGVDGDVRRKCIKFFTTIASDGGMQLSPHINVKKRSASVSQNVRPPGKKTSSKAIEIPQTAKVPEDDPLLPRLLEKFPSLDINWTEDQKTKWLDAFNMFMQKIYPELRK